MIITRLKGGFGNQMFQYACGRALAIRNNDILKMDTTGFEATENTDTPRQYALSDFNIQENFASVAEVEHLRNPFGLFSKVLRGIHAKIFHETYTGWHRKLLSKKSNIYLDGFWQTEKCFIGETDTIQKEFTLKKTLGAKAAAIALQIRPKDMTSTSSVSVHVRRGDVARDAATNQYYGITTPEYYTKAIAYISEKEPNIRVFVFSDDIDWVQKNIPINHPTEYVSGKNIVTDCEEIILMSMCDHNIIANSSFSWWGAWLNQNPNKIIVGPKQWIKTGEHRHKDIMPDSWIRI